MDRYFQPGNATARMYFLAGALKDKKQVCIISDHSRDYSLLQTFASNLFSQNIVLIDSISELVSIDGEDGGIFVVPPSILETQGNLNHLKKIHTLAFYQNQAIQITECINSLVDFDYEYDENLAQPFSYKRSGGVLSVVQSDTETLYHIEWFDEDIDSIIVNNIRDDTRDFIRQITFSHAFKQSPSIDKKDKNTEINLDLLDFIANFDFKVALGCDFLSYRDVLLSKMDIHISDFFADGGTSLDIEIPKMSEPRELINTIRKLQEESYTIECFTRYTSSLEDLIAFHSLGKMDFQETKNRHIQSFIDPKNKHALFADDVFGDLFVKKRGSKNIAKNLDLLLSLSPGDLVVHRDHGIGKFIDTQVKKTGEIEREYVKIAYRDDAFLFVPITEVYRISKYLGDSDQELAKLGSKEWERTMKQANEEILEIAESLLENSAKRKLSQGKSFGVFRTERKKFEDDFPYEYTADQYSAIEDIHRDMEADTPMDRLLAGDVGFGKTEVAMNAIYKAALSGYQVAFITPLVVLADEHYETCTRRFANFGIRVGILSRMSTPKQIQNTLKKIQEGSVDLVIGTHKLLSGDILWRRLGLLIVDEEHKFGVMHKEKIKQLRSNIDILSLSATPIPRSLNLALSGMRQMSILATPPKKRKPIDTIVSAWNPNTLLRSINSEIERGGQVIVIFNRILGLQSVADEIAGILQDNSIRILTTHGRMPADEIENRIHDFKKQKYDILITTTIIENGVNFLSANTILIVDPEDFGLASLHQLRGRVGRKDIQGYCYLMYRKGQLSDEQKDRLIMLANNNHLGAGFEIAMRDMEIRGAGEVLGIAQSGKTKHIGLSLYFRMLEEKVQQLKENKKQRPDTKIDLAISAVLPEELFLSQTDKLHFFREAQSADTLDELSQIETDIRENNEYQLEISRFFVLLRARLVLQDFGLEKLSRKGLYYIFDFQSRTSVDTIKLFLEEFDTEKNMILASMHKIKVPVRLFRSPLDLLQIFSGKI